jgi:hypothetical protein
MRTKLRWAPVGLLVAVGLLAVMAAPAAAATTVKSTVTITSGKGTEFTGKVTSPKAKCRAGRTVKLYRDDESSRVALAYQVEGTAKTNRMGLWTMDGSFLAGVYYARVLPMLIHLNGMAYRCAGDISLRQHF